MDDATRAQIENKVNRNKWLIRDYELKIQRLHQMNEALEAQKEQE